MKTYSRKSKTCLSVFCVCGTVFLSACGRDDLQDYEVTQFISSMIETDAISNAAATKEKQMQQSLAMMNEGRFDPCKISYENIKEAGKLDELAKVSSTHGFTTPEIWTEICDRVMLSFMAIKFESKADALENMKDIPDEMKSKIPPQALEMMEGAKKLAVVLRAAPQDDIAVVRRHLEALDQQAAQIGMTFPE